MIIGSIIQQPSDRIDYDIDCNEFLGVDGDYITEVTTTVEPLGLIAVSLLTSGTPKATKVWIEGGEADVDYKVEVTITTEFGRTKQEELLVFVKEF